MKLTALVSLLAVTLLGLTGTALAQQENPVPQQPKTAPRPAPRPTPAGEPAFGQDAKKCPFSIVGTWKAQISNTEARLYSFDGEGVIKVLQVSGNTSPREIATGKYEMVEPEVTEQKVHVMGSEAAAGQKAPEPMPAQQIAFTATGKNRIFGRTRTAMKVVDYDDSSITCEIPGIAGTTRWTRVDSDRYFMVLVARQDEFYDKSGSAFPMVIRLSGGVPTVAAAGTYAYHGKAVFGSVPPETYKDYLREARGDSEVILRLEINSRQYERALKVVQEWQRRARENALLYISPDSPVSLNNLLLVRAVTETLNLCQNDFDLYKLDYTYPKDWISDHYSPEFIPFFYFKELRRRNEARHIEYKKFQELVPLPNLASR